MPLETIDIIKTINQENIFVRKYFNKSGTNLNTIILYGGGLKTDVERLSFFSKCLIKNDISHIIFDFSGHGKSSSQKDNSLEKRLIEAKTVIEEFLNSEEGINVISFSMSGYISILLTEYFKVNNLILACPAVYSKKAFNISFGSKFTEILREESSWRETDAFEKISKFKGDLLIIQGKDDEVIPKEIPLLIIESAFNTNNKEIIYLPECDHSILSWMEKSEENSSYIIERIKGRII